MSDTMVEGTTFHQRRVVQISALDSEGAPAEGALLVFDTEGTPFGTIIIGDRAASIELPETFLSLRIVARFGDEALEQRLTLPFDTAHTFVFRGRAQRSRGARGEARCPDGTVGRPCVDCVINGIPIRICG